MAVQESYKEGGGSTIHSKDFRGDNGNTTDLFTFHGFAYGYNSTQTQLELKGIGGVDSDIVFFEDRNISQTDKSIVDAYTEIETLDKLYDRSSSWKVDNVAAEHPAIDSPLITVTGTTIDFGSQNLVVDANASQAFAVDTSTNTITIKASTLAAESNAFSSVTTTGSISLANGATIVLGYQDSVGKNVYTDIDWGTSDTYDIRITDLNDNTIIATHNDVANRFANTFVAPEPFGSGVKFELFSDISDTSTLFFETNFTDANALAFSVDPNEVSADPTGAAQHEALFLARKILQKTESMASALEGTTPTLTDDTNTITEQSAVSATKENQEAIKNLLLRILTKTTASHEALKGAN